MDATPQNASEGYVNGHSPTDPVSTVPDGLIREEMRGVDEFTPPIEEDGVIGWTMFDTPAARDGSVVALLPRERVGRVPNRALVRIESRQDDRSYLGIIQEGPFAEPDGLRGDAPVVVTVQSRSGMMMLPQYHGRIHIELMGQRAAGGIVPPRFRPMPSSPVFLLDAEETRDLLQCDGDIALGLVSGHDELLVGIPSDRKSVLPRHTGVLGTTGAGKTTTVSRMIQQAQASGMAVVLFDVEGEYAEMHRPADDPAMLRTLAERGIEPQGVRGSALYHLVGTEAANYRHPRRREFSPPFSRLSPYTVCEILDLNDAQQTRYWQAYETCKLIMRDLGVYPQKTMGQVEQRHECRIERLDEFSEGYPRMTLQALLDVVSAFLHVVSKHPGAPRMYTPLFRKEDNVDRVMSRVKQTSADFAVSWRALYSRLYRLMRLNVFDARERGARSIDYRRLVRPGAVSVIDLSDMESPDVRNLVIADIIRGIEEAQESEYEAASRAAKPPPRTLVVVEEAHEFLSAERIRQMPNLFQTVSRIARRGRKRWLGLVFVTQHPQFLPDELFGLINNYVLHRINDAQTISRLRRSIGGIDAPLWDRVTSLAPGQAVVSFTHLTRPMLATVDPSPSRLRMAEG